MEKYLRQPVSVPLSKLYLDPNNPRLSLDEAPGYADATSLFDEELQEKILGEFGADTYGIDELVATIVGQGWMPIDAILTWPHPDDPNKHVVVEGNRRVLSLKRLHGGDLDKARSKLQRMQAKAGTYSKGDLAAAEEQVRRLEQVIADTTNLSVTPIDATSPDELLRKLPRVLAVRHITGAKEWGNYAEDIWLLSRYQQLFQDRHGDGELWWDADIIKQVGQEASLGDTTTRRQIRAAKWFSHFRAEWEDELPDDEEFEKTDYYLFENISRRPWVRQKLGVGDDALAIPEQGEKALFTWIFKEPRTKKADTNPNIFYRHENIVLWDQINKYDESAGTSFASRFDVENPDDAPTMAAVEAEYLMHKASKKPHAVLDDLLRRLSDFTAQQLASEGGFLKPQLQEVNRLSAEFLKMIDATEN